MAGNGFSIADYAVFSVTILISLGIGIYYALSGGKQKTTSEYLVGNRQMKILPVALSLMVSFESSIMMLGFPAETYVYGIMFWLSNFGFLVANLIGIRIVVPLVHPLRLTSVYEIFYMGIVLFGPGIALEAVTSFPLWASVLLVALASVIYTSIGSMVAGGISNVFHINAQNERLNFFDFNPDPTVRHTFWSLIFGSCIRMVTLTFNQTSVQRISAMNKQSEANKVLLLAGPAFFVTLSLATLEGLVAFAYFYTIRCDPLASKEIRNPNQISFSVLSAFGGPASGLFLYSAFCPWATKRGALIGTILGVMFMFWLSAGSNFSKTLKRTPYLSPAPTDRCTIENITLLQNMSLIEESTYKHYSYMDDYTTSAVPETTHELPDSNTQ
ncbi:hypothetical protein KUTeg_012295, partial [Tegillarca granosa]